MHSFPFGHGTVAHVPIENIEPAMAQRGVVPEQSLLLLHVVLDTGAAVGLVTGAVVGAAVGAGEGAVGARVGAACEAMRQDSARQKMQRLGAQGGCGILPLVLVSWGWQ